MNCSVLNSIPYNLPYLNTLLYWQKAVLCILVFVVLVKICHVNCNTLQMET